MKSNFKKGSCITRFRYSLIIISIFFSAFLLTTIHTPLQAQVTQFSKPSWWFGVAGAANINFYRGSTQQLNSNFTVPAIFHDGTSAGLYLAPMVEYHRPGSKWGGMLQAGYDSRRGSFDEVMTPCNCPANLSTDLSYLTVEPSLRFAPFRSDFYLFAGPRLAFNLTKSFTYKQEANPAFPEQQDNPDVKGDFSHMNEMLLSSQIGAGYDIPLTVQDKQTQMILSPFISFHPYFGQSPRSIETWNITTLRVGAALKFGRRHKASPSDKNILDSKVSFSINAPKNIPEKRRVRETFPLRNYIFFNRGSTEIPNRYVLLKKDQVKDFKEDQLEVVEPKELSGRSERGMIVYYNILNIIGDRMQKNPSARITLVGSSEEGPEDARAMTMSVKNYLVNVFDIDASRINIEGREKPKIPSEQPGGTRELELLREGDRRVSIESNSPALLMEFQSGSEAMMKPVEIMTTQNAPPDSYVSFNVDGGEDAFSSWSLEIKDEKGTVQYFGPYTQDKISIPGKSILGTRPEGDYKVTMIGQTKSGKTVRKERSVHMVLWTPPQNEEGMRFSVIFEFDQSKSNAIYEKYLTDIVTPKIPKGGTVIIHGHTDIIGDENHNRTLSLARANDVKSIIKNALSKSGRNDVKFEIYGLGEDQNVSPFENNFPEERFYNRTVIIDIIPGK